MLSILILLQSCFSYKTVDLADISVDKKQKLKISFLGSQSKTFRILKNWQLAMSDGESYFN